jgi:hypothetical protein
MSLAERRAKSLVKDKKMRTKTKLLLALGILSLAVAGGMVFLASTITAAIPVIDGLILAAGVFAVAGVSELAVGVTGAIKRGIATKNQVAAAEREYATTQKAMVKGQELTDSKIKARDLKLAKGIVYMNRNGHTGLFGLKYKPGYSHERIKTENATNAYKLYNSQAGKQGKNFAVKNSSNKLSELNEYATKLRKSSVAGAVAPEFQVAYKMRTVDTYDYRTTAGFNNKQYAEEFKSFINSSKSIETRYGEENRKDNGYMVQVKYPEGQNGYKNTYAGSNAETEMDGYELMLLKDAKLTIKNNGGNFEPIVITKTHFMNDKSKTSAHVGSDVYIESMKDLDERINTLESALDKNSKVERTGGYLYRAYEEVPQKEDEGMTK